jgi:hypothetical protein
MFPSTSLFSCVSFGPHIVIQEFLPTNLRMYNFGTLQKIFTFINFGKKIQLHGLKKNQNKLR